MNFCALTNRLKTPWKARCKTQHETEYKTGRNGERIGTNCTVCSLLVLAMFSLPASSDETRVLESSPSASTTSRATHNAEQDFSADVPRFIEEAAVAGIDHHYSGPWEYFVGGGVAVFDCNSDRMPDLFVAGGQGSSTLYINRSTTGGALRFEKQVSDITTLSQVSGAYPIDIDNDGNQDLVVLRVGENRLLKGGPDCRFTPANTAFGFEGGREWSTAFSATFEPAQSTPTLAIGNYVDRAAPGSPWGTCHDNYLYRPASANTVRYGPPLPLTPGHCALSMLFTDWNRSGSDALRITNDRQYHRGGEEQLWRLDAGRYPRLYGRADGWASVVIWGMGIAEADLNADGFPEYALTSMGDTRLQSLNLQQATEEDRPAYEDVAYELGATAHRPYTGSSLLPSTGWHAEFDDINNDTQLDLFISKGNVERMPDFAAFDPDNLLLGRRDGRFVEQGDTAGLALQRRGRGASVVDFNADGQLDIVVVNREEPLSLFRSTPSDAGAPGNWLQIELAQPGHNRHAIGARLSIRSGNTVQTRRLQIGGGHASGHSGFVHVGLGVAERASVRVQWPDGQWSAPYRVFANHFVQINRDSDTVNYWYPPAANPDQPAPPTLEK